MRARDTDGELAAAYACGELEGEELRAFEARLATDASLARRARELKEVVEAIATDPSRTAARDLAPEIIARVRTRGLGGVLRIGRRDRILKAAAALLLVAASGFFIARLARVPGDNGLGTDSGGGTDANARLEAVEGALDWLSRTQRDDGSWDPVQWGGQERSRVGLTGMAILAIVRHDPRLELGGRGRAVDRGVEYLLSRQRSNGCVGAESGGMICNHGIATVALIEAHAARGRQGLQSPIEAALRHIAREQLDSGGWGYRRPNGAANTEVSVWQLHALDLARRKGFPVESGAIERGVRWLNGAVGLGGRLCSLEPCQAATLAAMKAFCVFSLSHDSPELRSAGPAARGALLASIRPSSGEVDLYRWFFTAAAVRVGGCRELEPWLSNLQAELVRRRNRTGLLAGSWDPEGRLSTVGGRLYATIMAALVLEPAADSASG